MLEDRVRLAREYLCILLTIAAAFSSPILLLHVSAVGGGDAAVMAKLAGSLTPTPAGWFGSNPCKWSGVDCDSTGRVSSINFASRSVSGELPSDLNLLSNLKTLSLQKNQLSGPLPSFENLASLEEIYLDNNNFTSIPRSFLSGLKSLQTLSISENHNLSPWTIPDSLSDSKALSILHASHCNIVGSIPDIFRSLPNLQIVRISHNNLTGSLPASLSSSAVQGLLMNNQLEGLSGTIEVLDEMRQLRQVWLHSNKFSGRVPDLSGCTELFDLQLRDNQLTGVVPPSLSSLPKLANVSLQNNMLQGAVPTFNNGVVVSLGSSNHFCRTTPGPCDPQVTALLAVAGALGYPMALAESWQGNDPCKGWTYISCDSQHRVTVINFAKQNWTGTISPVIANLTGLKTLLLTGNHLTGTIPNSLTSLANLQLLDVSNNNLFGKVPPFPSHVTLRTSGNPLLGKDLPAGGGSKRRSSDSKSSDSSDLTWVILCTVAGTLIVLLASSMAIYRLCFKKNGEKNKRVKWSSIGKPKKTEEPDEGRPPESKPMGENSLVENDIQISDGGNVYIDIELLRLATNNFSEANVLGRGGFGVVYRGQLHDKTKIAVKRMGSTGDRHSGCLSEFKAEIEVLTRVRHRHLVALLGFCIDGNERLIVYEYMSQGTLEQHLFQYGELNLSPLTWKQRVIIALDVARGVEYLHSLAQQSFIHRDLKPSNILLGDDMRAKVSDFGLVKSSPVRGDSLVTKVAGTFGYLAPEYPATGKVTTKCDVYSFGVVLMEMITGRRVIEPKLPSLVTWFRKLLVNKETLITHLDPSLGPSLGQGPDQTTLDDICTVALLAGHCTTVEPHQRLDMARVVNVLGPLVEEWAPTREYYGEEEEGEKMFKIAFPSPPQALENWQSNETAIVRDLSGGGVTTYVGGGR